MKRFMSLLISVVMAGTMAICASAQGTSNTSYVSVADYDITLTGKNAVVEREIIEFVAEKDENLAHIYANMLRSRASSIVLSPTELVDLTLCGAPESDKAEVWASMEGEAYEVEYYPGGVIIMNDLSEPEIEVVSEARAASSTYKKSSTSKKYTCVMDGVATNVKQTCTFETGSDSKGKYVVPKSITHSQTPVKSSTTQWKTASLSEISHSFGSKVYSGTTWGKMSTRVYSASDKNGKIMTNTINSNTVK